MAWIKANFPLAFYAAMITYDSSKFALYKTECLKKKINIYGPHINKSNKDTTIDIKNHALRIGLNQIKGLGNAAVNTIINNRTSDYISINDFFSRGVGRAVNKKIIETLIYHDCFINLPIVFDDDTISENSPLFGKKPLYLGRGELLTWYELYYNSKTEKSEKNYLLIKENLPRNLQEDKTLQFEKDGTIVVPFSKLNEFGVKGSNSDGSFTEQDLNNLIVTRKKPKGKLLIHKTINKVNPLLKPFLQYEAKILASKQTNNEMYLYDIFNNDGVSFKMHPLSCMSENIANLSQCTANANTKVNISGIIISLKSTLSLKNKIPMYPISIMTPYEIVDMTLWDNEYKQHAQQLKIGSFVKIQAIYNNTTKYFSYKQINLQDSYQEMCLHSKIFDNIYSYIFNIQNQYSNQYNNYSFTDLEKKWINIYLKLQNEQDDHNIKVLKSALTSCYDAIVKEYKANNK